MKESKTIKAYDYCCTNCNHSWLSKIEEFYCPNCKCTILEFQKLK